MAKSTAKTSETTGKAELNKFSLAHSTKSLGSSKGRIKYTLGAGK